MYSTDIEKYISIYNFGFAGERVETTAECAAASARHAVPVQVAPRWSCQQFTEQTHETKQICRQTEQ